MAISLNTVFEVRQGGSDTVNGGGFVTGAAGTDWTRQDSAQYTLTNGVTNGTPIISTSSASPDMVGNIARISGGTGSITPAFYQITSQVTGVSITVDTAVGLTTGTGVNINIGGAFATPGYAASVMNLTGQKTWVKYSSTVYNITTSSLGAAGPISMPNSVGCTMEGYDVVRGDRTGNMPTYRWTAASPGSNTYIVGFIGQAYQSISNMIFDANSVVNVSGMNFAALRIYAIGCVVLNANGSAGSIGFNLTAGYCSSCKALNCTTGFSISASVSGCALSECYASGCTTGILSGTHGGEIKKCIASKNTNGFSNTGTNGFLNCCTADGNTTAGFVNTGSVVYISCLSTNQSGAGGIGFSIGTNSVSLYKCAVYNNLSNVTGTPLINNGLITLNGDPYVSRATGDFRPNNGPGLLLRSVGLGVFGQTDNIDIGAVQHSDTPKFRGRRGT